MALRIFIAYLFSYNEISLQQKKTAGPEDFVIMGVHCSWEDNHTDHTYSLLQAGKIAAIKMVSSQMEGRLGEGAMVQQEHTDDERWVYTCLSAFYSRNVKFFLKNGTFLPSYV